MALLFLATLSWAWRLFEFNSSSVMLKRLQKSGVKLPLRIPIHCKRLHRKQNIIVYDKIYFSWFVINFEGQHEPDGTSTSGVSTVNSTAAMAGGAVGGGGGGSLGFIGGGGAELQHAHLAAAGRDDKWKCSDSSKLESRPTIPWKDSIVLEEPLQ